MLVWKNKGWSAGCFTVQPGRRFPMFWRQQHDSLYSSQRRLLWLWGVRPFLLHVHSILEMTTFTPLQWLGWVGRARHLSLPQWQVLLRERWTQGHGHSLWQGEQKCSRITMSMINNCQVGDGLCDCCDGTDEWETGAGGKKKMKQYQFWCSLWEHLQRAWSSRSRGQTGRA